ncbi:MAG TPA: hypothetical protein VFM04_03770 [Candidatus Methylomirabilis sp.]|nr:hypothetical protein [Candidatus Methylomirabilis sp.]
MLVRWDHARDWNVLLRRNPEHFDALDRKSEMAQGWLAALRRNDTRQGKNENDR